MWSTNANSFKIKSRTLILFENIVKVGFREITSESCECKFATCGTLNLQANVATSDVAQQIFVATSVVAQHILV